MQDKIRLLVEFYISVSALASIPGYANYVYNVNKAYYDAENKLESEELCEESKQMEKSIKSFKREIILEELLRTLISFYNIYNSNILLSQRDKFYDLYNKYFTSRFEDINDNERLEKNKTNIDEAVKLILSKRKK